MLVLALVAGCSGDGSSDRPLPDGVSVGLEQTRSDLPTRRVQVRVQNDGERPVVVESLTASVPGWASDAGYEGPATVAPGGALNLTVDAPAASCDARPEPHVRLRYRVGDGEPRTSGTPAEDRYGSLERLLARDCVDTVLDVDAGTPRREGDVLVLPLTFAVADGAVRLHAIDPTVLLDLAPGEDGGLAALLGAGRTRAEREVRLVPARCDAHVVAEDKVGTLLPIRVTGPHGDVTTLLRPPDAVRAAMLGFVADVCGIGSGDDPLLDD